MLYAHHLIELLVNNIENEAQKAFSSIRMDNTIHSTYSAS